MSSDSSDDSESEIDVENLEGSDEGDESQTAPAKQNRRKSAPVKVIPFHKALEQLDRVYESLPSLEGEETIFVGGRSGSRFGKRKPRAALKLKFSVWDEVCLAIETEAQSHGLDVDILDKVWDLLSHPHASLSDRHTSLLLLSLIPKVDRVSGERVHEVIGRISILKPRSKVAALKYLIGLFDYNLCEKDEFSVYISYSRIFLAGRSNDLIPWICALLKRISTPELVTRSLVNDMQDLAHKITVTSPVLKSVLDLLRYFQGLRPDLIKGKIHEIAAGASKKVRLDEPFLEALYKAKRRFLGIPADEEDDENLMETETVYAYEKVGLFFERLNEQCFPEFLLHRDDDPEADDYAAILRLSKHDQMRCALKTEESLPLIVRDEQVFQCFNNTISILLQHKFTPYYDPKDEQRYNFLLKRIWQVTVLGGKLAPAVADWLLDYLLTWNGYRFKAQIYQLLCWLRPIQFTDGYVHVLRKLETFFLDGADAGDRMQVWHTLHKLASDWIVDLQSAVREEAEAVDSLKKVLEELMDFMDSLVAQVATVNGHRDVTFLVHCCETYTVLNNSMALLELPPFYVFPPLQLWVMTVLSSSLEVMDAFCTFLSKATPRRSLNHLKGTPHQVKYQKWNEEVLPDVFRYFSSNQLTADTPIFMAVYANELDSLEDLIDAEGKDSAFGGQCRAKVDQILEDLHLFSAIDSEAFSGILASEDQRHQRSDGFASFIDPQKAQDQAPNLLNWLTQVDLVQTKAKANGK